MNTKLKWDWQVRNDLPGITETVLSLEVETPADLVDLGQGRQLEIAPFACRVFAQCDQYGQVPPELSEEIVQRAHTLIFRKAMEQVAVIFHLQ